MALKCQRGGAETRWRLLRSTSVSHQVLRPVPEDAGGAGGGSGWGVCASKPVEVLGSSGQLQRVKQAKLSHNGHRRTPDSFPAGALLDSGRAYLALAGGLGLRFRFSCFPARSRDTGRFSCLA